MRITFFSSDNNDTISTSRAVDCSSRSILENIHRFDVRWIQRIHITAHDTIYYNQRFVRKIYRVEPSDINGIVSSWSAIYFPNIDTSNLALYSLFDRYWITPDNIFIVHFGYSPGDITFLQSAVPHDHHFIQ